jgi:hypothetical protein
MVTLEGRAVVFYSIPECAERLGVSREHAWRLRDRLMARKVGRKSYVVSAQDLERVAAERAAEKAGPRVSEVAAMAAV